MLRHLNRILPKSNLHTWLQEPPLARDRITVEVDPLILSSHVRRPRGRTVPHVNGRRKVVVVRDFPEVALVLLEVLVIQANVTEDRSKAEN